MGDVEISGAPAVPGIDTLGGCPAEEHVRWLISQRRPGAGKVDAAAALTHVAMSPELAKAASHFMYLESRGPHAVTEVAGWRRGSNGAVVLEYNAADGHDYEIHAGVAPDGRLEPPRLQRALGGIEVIALRPDDLSREHRAALFDVFVATYDRADHDHLGDQLERFDSLAIARHDGRVVGFSITDIRPLDLPVIGRQICSRAGLSCVLPEARRAGLMTSMAIAAATHSALESGHPLFSLGASRFATPASLNMAVRRHEGRPWPTVDDPFALHDHPTPTQVAVARALAVGLGGAGYDEATGVCIGSGKAIGTPLVEPDVAPEVAARFGAVDRERGDSLLWITWLTPPPDSWFD